MSQKPNYNKNALKFKRFNTKNGVAATDLYEYEYRTSVIKNPAGDEVFKMDNVEVPKDWSQVATDILAQKYFRKAGVPLGDGTTGSETSVKQVAHRLADCWKTWGERYGYFATKKDAQVFYDELVFSILGQMAAPNSPQWFNTGLHNSYGITGGPQGHMFVDPETGKTKKSTSAYERPQPHACFILSVSDDLVNEGGIMDLWVREARIFKYGSGVGTNFSSIRGANEKLSGGGNSSGLMSFLKIGDRAAGAIKSGGTTRRAAKMVCLDLDHPEILEFINWKKEEEKKVQALIDAGYDSGYEGEAYATVSGQNSNNSVRIPNKFFEALKNDGEWDLISRTNGKPIKSVPAQKVWDDISFAAWACADPGVQYDTTINEWHTCPEGGQINASNPCSEYMFLDNTACNLASLNLRKYYNEETKELDVEAIKYASRLWTVVLEISVLMAQFPSKEVAELSYQYRTLGLGYANIGSVFMVSGIAYDSPEASAICGAVTAILTGTSYATSAEMASFLGTFEQYDKNKEHMLRVMNNHRYAAYNLDEYDGLSIKPVGIDPAYCPEYLLGSATSTWDQAVQWGEKYGYRNAQTTVIAPTGTIGLVMDCDTTGIEPDFALVKFKKLSGGGYFKIVNQSVPLALKNLGYEDMQINEIVNYAKGYATLENAPHINHDTLRAKGFKSEDLEKIEAGLASAFEISFAFNQWVLGDATMERLGFTSEQYNKEGFSLLRALGFSKSEIHEANDFVCGTMTVEGAPHLKNEHLAVFDCANKCGEIGERYIHAHGHIKMMAAAQPFLSGAISKTINLPNEATIEDIKSCYQLSWELGTKANALYRDGSKLSQPLSNKSDVEETEEEDAISAVDNALAGAATLSIEELTQEQVLEAAQKILDNSKSTEFMRQLSGIVERKKLPWKRRGFTQKAKVGGQTLFVRTGEYNDGTLGEIFIDMHREGATFRSLMNCFSIAVSIGLQYGVPLDEYVSKFTFARFEPSGMVEGHPNIKNSTSIIDYIFRLLGFEYLDRTDLVHIKPTKEEAQAKVEAKQNKMSDTPKPTVSVTSAPTVKPVSAAQPATAASFSAQQPKATSGDALPCTNCGSLALIRNGTCHLCTNCGTTTGCS
ncbi:MAG: vitamin B12-dependent ribonucleotide reductase [Bacteroidia bacterium]|jgi:ribonucleoside-diphosphate reductase alpha chain|nr:vitamin B12-dependent ribonucleotide reductase [Bacteroidia bacterium]